MPSSPALVLHFPDSRDAALRDRLVELLAEHSLLAIHENDVREPSRWLAHFGSSAARDAAAAAVSALPEASAVRLEAVEVEDEDWARRTQADLPAIQVGRLVVAPPWDIPDAEVLIIIEPSRGFGTGHHESTRLCLALLQSRELTRLSVLDVGTGSGVLAIAAARLGAAAVSAIDIDPDAVENARENIARNDVAHLVEAHVRDFTVDPSIPAADVVTANLTGTLLARHARDLSRLVRPAGTLIVAGFTVDESDRVSDAFAPELAVTESAEENGWWAFALARGTAGR